MKRYFKITEIDEIEEMGKAYDDIDFGQLTVKTEDGAVIVIDDEKEQKFEMGIAIFDLKEPDLMGKLLSVQQKAEKEGKKHFTCPFCKGDAEWERSEFNGHLHIWCNDCPAFAME